MRYLNIVLPLAALPALVGASEAAAQTVTYVNAAREFAGPLSWHDEKSGLTFYVESDGRHVSAIDRRGKIRWTVNPFEAGKLEPYRTARPRIIHIGTPNEWMTRVQPGDFVAISFDSSQFGMLDVTDGRFIFMGQD